MCQWEDGNYGQRCCEESDRHWGPDMLVDVPRAADTAAEVEPVLSSLDPPHIATWAAWLI